MLDKLKKVANHPLSSKSDLLDKIDSVTNKDEMPLTKRALKNFRAVGNALVFCSAIAAIPGADPEAVNFNLHGDTPPEFTMIGPDNSSNSKLSSLFDEFTEVKGDLEGRALDYSVSNIKNKLSGHYRNPVGGTVPVFFHKGNDANLGFYEKIYQALVSDGEKGNYSYARMSVADLPSIFMGEPILGHVNILDSAEKVSEHEFFLDADVSGYNLLDFERVFTFHHELHHSTYQDSTMFLKAVERQDANMVEGSADIAGLLMARKTLNVDDYSFRLLTRSLLVQRAGNVEDLGDYGHNTTNTILAFLSAFEEDPDFFKSMSDKEIYNISLVLAGIGSQLKTEKAMYQLFAENEIDPSPEFHKKILNEYFETGEIPEDNDRALFSLSHDNRDNPRRDDSFWIELEHKNKYLSFKDKLNSSVFVAEQIAEIHEKRFGIRIPKEFDVKDQVFEKFEEYGISMKSHDLRNEVELKMKNRRPRMG